MRAPARDTSERRPGKYVPKVRTDDVPDLGHVRIAKSGAEVSQYDRERDGRPGTVDHEAGTGTTTVQVEAGMRVRFDADDTFVVQACSETGRHRTWVEVGHGTHASGTLLKYVARPDDVGHGVAEQAAEHVCGLYRRVLVARIADLPYESSEGVSTTYDVALRTAAAVASSYLLLQDPAGYAVGLERSGGAYRTCFRARGSEKPEFVMRMLSEHLQPECEHLERIWLPREYIRVPEPATDGGTASRERIVLDTLYGYFDDLVGEVLKERIR